MHVLAKKFCFLVASALAVSILFISIVYACSRIGPMNMTMQAYSMSGMDGMGEGMRVQRGPCSEHKQDICKTVRDRMLSIQPSVHKAEASLELIVLPLAIGIETVEQVVFSPVSFDREIFNHPVFKLSLPFSFSVLRI